MFGSLGVGRRRGAAAGPEGRVGYRRGPAASGGLGRGRGHFQVGGLYPGLLGQEGGFFQLRGVVGRVPLKGVVELTLEAQQAGGLGGVEEARGAQGRERFRV